MGRRLYALVSLVVLVGFVAPQGVRADVAGTWVRPVTGAVARPFDAPRSRFGAGHLGVDLAVAPGTPVRAAGPGLVVFAGSVAGALHVVVAHAGDLRTSYSFLASVSVRRGDSVAAGEVVGTSGGTGAGHNGSVVHIGLRRGDTYVDPMLLFAPVDLASVVHLAPTTDPPHPTSTSGERRGLVAGLVHEGALVVHAAGVVVHAAGDGVATAGRTAVGAELAFGRAFARSQPLVVAATAAGAATAEWAEQQRVCDPHAPPANGEGGSGHRVMVVAGIESSMTAGRPPLALPVAKLGYHPDEVNYFSYAADGGDNYTAADTEGPLMVAAHHLAAQLRAMQRAEPGREVDLLAHSQGGVVVEAFLTLLYERGRASYPPLGTVVTLSAPLRGDPLAGAVSGIAGTGIGSSALHEIDALGHSAGKRLPLEAAALHDLRPDSALMRKLDAARLPDEVELTTIGAATDAIVPGTAATRPGAQRTMVTPRALNAHGAILEDPSALRAIRAALENKALPCQSLGSALVGTFVPITISTLEERAGSIGKAVARAADGRL